MNRYHFKISRELLLQNEGDLFRKLNRFLGNFRIEGEDYRGDTVISFYSNEPIKEGWSPTVSIKSCVAFTMLLYNKSIMLFKSLLDDVLNE